MLADAIIHSHTTGRALIVISLVLVFIVQGALIGRFTASNERDDFSGILGLLASGALVCGVLAAVSLF